MTPRKQAGNRQTRMPTVRRYVSKALQKAMSRLRKDPLVDWRQQDEMRNQFLEQVRSSERAVLDELHSLLSVYSALPEKRQNLGTGVLEISEEGQQKFKELGYPAAKSLRMNLGSLPFAWHWQDVLDAAEAGDPTATAIRDGLRDWAARWFKDEPNWLLLEALEALQRWKEESTNPHLKPPAQLDWAPRDPFLSYQYHSSTLEEPPDFKFKYRGWRFEGEDRVDWIRELDVAFADARAEYVHRIIKFVSSAQHHSFEEVLGHYETSAWHMTAFVEYQLLDVSRADLSFKYDRSLETIDDLIKRISKSLDIKARTERRRKQHSHSRLPRPPRPKPVRTGSLPR